MNSRTVGLEKLLCILCLCPLLLCDAGSLRLLNGESRSGKLAMTDSCSRAAASISVAVVTS